MKNSLSFRLFLLPFALVLTATSLAEDAAKSASPFWSEDVTASIRQASGAHKDLLLYFTTDHCGCCRVLEKVALETPSFQSTAPQHFVPVKFEVLYDNAPQQSATVKKQVDEWAKKCDVQGYPTILLADPSGRPYAKASWTAISPEAYFKLLVKLQSRRVHRDEHLADAAKATGEAKAQALDAALLALQGEDSWERDDYDAFIVRHYRPEVDEIIKLGSPALKARYTRLLNAPASTKLLQEKLPEILKKAKEAPKEAVLNLEALAGNDLLIHDDRQKILFTACRICQFEIKDMIRAKKLFDAAVALDPESDTGRKLRKVRAQVFREETVK